MGLIKILKTARISDGIVRLYYVAGELALLLLNEESSVINHLTSDWGISQDDLLPTAARFFEGYKRLSTQVSRQASTILDLTVRLHLLDPASRLLLVRSSEPTSTLYISNMPQHAQRLHESGKGVVFVGDGFVYGLLGDGAALDVADVEAALRAMADAEARQRAERSEEREQKSKHDADAKEEVKEQQQQQQPPAKQEKAMLVKATQTLSISRGKDKKTGKQLKDTLTGVLQFDVFRMTVRPESAIEYFCSKGFVRGGDH